VPDAASAANPEDGDRRAILLLDGHSLAYRAFYALPDTLRTQTGQLTNAVYGFTSMLIKLLGDRRPTPSSSRSTRAVTSSGPRPSPTTRPTVPAPRTSSGRRST
jgi:5'-3' exonuclease